MPTLALPLTVSRAFVGLASLAIVLHLLYWLQPVLVPFALAVMLTFVLSPIVTFLQRHSLPRVVAVGVVVVVAFSLLGAIGWGVARQMNTLVDTLPEHEHNLKNRIAELQSGEASFPTKVRNAMSRISQQIEETAPPSAMDPPPQRNAAEPVAVTIVPRTRTPEFSMLWTTYGPLGQPMAAAALSVVLVIFMLIGREDLRDRVIRLVGRGRLTITTKALDEAGERISRFLLLQFAVNASYGVAVSLGLYFIGLPYALMWGFFAAVFRYLPYVGAWIAALLPIALSLLVSDTWTVPLLIVGLFTTLELISNMFIEPWLYGRGVGVSETATLVMVAFWTWLWGPVGLVLATPLTVLLVLLGKYVPFLKFFDVLLGDQPALEPADGYYQRLLAHDQDEASEIAGGYFKARSLEETYDSLMVPTLTFAKRDLGTDSLDTDDHRFVLGATREIMEELSVLQTRVEARTRSAQADEAVSEKLRILACPAKDETDEIGLLMLKQLLEPERYDVRLTTTDLLASEVLAVIEETRPGLLCIAALPPGGVSRVRLLCMRVRTRYPDLKIFVGRWGLEGSAERTRDQLLAAGADEVVTSLADTRDRIVARAPLLTHQACALRGDANGLSTTALLEGAPA